MPLVIWTFIPKEKGKSSEPYFCFNYFCSCEIFAYVCLYFLQVGAADYIAVAKNYHTVFISDIPVMSMRIRDKVLLPHSCCHPTVIFCMCVTRFFCAFAHPFRFFFDIILIICLNSLGTEIYHPHWWIVQSSLLPLLYSSFFCWRSFSRNRWGTAFRFGKVIYAYVINSQI